MKKLTLTSLLTLAFTAVSFAQYAPKHQGEKTQMMQVHQNDNFTPEQRASLKAKHLTLTLELSDKQQKEITKLFFEEAQMMQKHHQKMKVQKEAGKKADRFSMMNQHMDLKIDHQRKMKNILSQEQYAKWSKIKQHKGEAVIGSMKKGMMMKKRMNKSHQCDGNCQMHKDGKGQKQHKGGMYQKQAPSRR